MKIVDIRTKEIPDRLTPAVSRASFNLEVQHISAAQAKQLPHYEVELGKQEKRKGWFRGWKQIGFSFTTHFGIKRYRVKSWFILNCFLLLFAMQGLFIAGSSLDLLEKGRLALHDVSTKNVFAALVSLKETNKSLASLGEIPKNFSDKLQTLNLGSAWAEFFLRISGYYNPRLYLIMFQNNAEMRATGGFMGSYALVGMNNGELEIKKLEGIYNPSGQQRIAVIPPLPMQKVSSSWMFHDANWFFDFPTSAKTIAWFYEKTGGPTVDGVIVLTTEVVTRLLELTGPIEIKEFGLTVDKENFITIIQYEVEVNYKERGLADPKEILHHLAPLLIQRLSQLDRQLLIATIFESLERKEIMFYFDRQEEEAFMNYLHWDGAILSGSGDYFAVVNSNVNGYKTDRMIEQKVSLRSEIQSDGSIINTVSINRLHKGGNEAYDWYNRVNGNFMRVYVPKGATLLDAKGHTKEEIPIKPEYQKEGVIAYPELKKTMDSGLADPRTGTYIWEEQEKTVFGNWVYVSPQETVTVQYTYRLPFKLPTENKTLTLPLTIQKQPGITYELSRTVAAPSFWQVAWQHPTNPASPRLLEKDERYETVFSLQ